MWLPLAAVQRVMEHGFIQGCILLLPTVTMATSGVTTALSVWGSPTLQTPTQRCASTEGTRRSRPSGKTSYTLILKRSVKTAYCTIMIETKKYIDIRAGQRLKVLIAINHIVWWVNSRLITLLKFNFKSTQIAVKRDYQMEWHIIFIPNVIKKQKIGQVILREFYWLTQYGLNMKLMEHHRFRNCKQAVN